MVAQLLCQYESSMRDFQSLLQKKIASPATSSMKGMDQATITFLFTKILEEEYGIRGKENVFVEKFEEKKLVIIVYKSLWYTELLLQRESLLVKLQEVIGSARVVRDLVIRKK